MISALATKNAIRYTMSAKHSAKFSSAIPRAARRVCCTHFQGARPKCFTGRSIDGRMPALQRHEASKKTFSNIGFVANNAHDSVGTSYSSIIAAAIAASVATWGTTTVSSSESAFQVQNNSYANEETSPSHAGSIMEQAKPGIKELGSALAKLHERQKVTLGRLLQDFYQLAEEAKVLSSGTEDVTTDEEGIQKKQPCSGETETCSPRGDSTFIDVPSGSLTDLSPQAAWNMITEISNGAIFSKKDLKRVVLAATEVLKHESTVVDLRDQNGIDTITIVGDIHGDFNSLFDILTIFENKFFDSNNEVQVKDKGLGSPWNGTGAIVFNGDFVDRGENSVGVLLTLLLLKIAYPKNVYLNRGNHEDALLSTVYGFTEELQSRYGEGNDDDIDDIWEDIGNLFSVLPLCVRTDTAAIMHGGIPSDGFKLSELETITAEQRSKIKSLLEPGDDALCQLVQNVLWSDPKPELGVQPNEDRGAGIFFGPDVTHRFLTDHNLKYLIRSHEVTDEGYFHMECSDENAAITVFSSVNYPNGEGYNFGAVIHLDSDGTFAPICFHGHDANDGNFQDEYFDRTMNSLVEVIAENKSKLLSSFKEIAGTGTLVTTKQWADVMSNQLNLNDVDWLSLQPYLAPNVLEEEAGSKDMIDYDKFLDLHCNILSGTTNQVDDATVETLRRNHEILFTVFKFLDTNGNGMIDQDEFRAGIELLSKKFPDEERFSNPDELFDSIDIDGSGEIDLNEFEKSFQAAHKPYYEAVFQLFDKDHSGTIDRDEFKEALVFLNCRLSDGQKFIVEESDIIFDKLDLDRSGELELDEFKDLLTNMSP